MLQSNSASAAYAGKKMAHTSMPAYAASAVSLCIMHQLVGEGNGIYMLVSSEQLIWAELNSSRRQVRGSSCRAFVPYIDRRRRQILLTNEWWCPVTM